MLSNPPRPEQYLGVVFAVAQQLANNQGPAGELCRLAWGDDIEPYLGPGYIGLCQAIAAGWDPERFGAATYLLTAIRPQILRDAKKDMPADHHLEEDPVARMEDDQIERAELASLVRKTVAALPEPERSHVMMFFGLNGEEPIDKAAIGRKTGKTKERARQIVKKAVEMIREKMPKP